MEKIFEDFATENGTVFEMILPGYMTYKQISKLFNITERAASEYYRDKCQQKQELINDGMKQVTFKKFHEIKEDFVGNDTTHEKIYGNNKINKID